MNAEKSIPPEVTAPGVSEKDLEQLGRLAADKFAAAFKSVVSADTVSDHDGDDFNWSGVKPALAMISWALVSSVSSSLENLSSPSNCSGVNIVSPPFSKIIPYLERENNAS